MENLLEHLEEELNFIKEVKGKLIESVQVNYQRLAEIDGRNPNKDKTDLKSSDSVSYTHLTLPTTPYV